jgi:class 3 adenylate cyclase/tetratricopeptide (TPR) repeat protein
MSVMHDTPSRQEHPPNVVTVLYAAVSAVRQVLTPDDAPAVRTAHEVLESLCRIAVERGGNIVSKGGDSMLACFADAVEAAKAAIRMQRSAPGEEGGESPLAIRIALHCGRGYFGDGALHGDVAGFAAKAENIARAGCIYVSAAVSAAVREMKAIDLNQVDMPQGVLAGGFAFYELVWRAETDCSPGFQPGAGGAAAGDVRFFAYGQALLEGRHPPCFYCGTGKHLARDCPSKHLPYGTHGLEGLGRLSMGEINGLFERYLDEAGGKLPAPAEADAEDPAYLAPWGFYELKKVFQIRFMNVIWSALPRDDWYRVRESGRETSAKGGVLWIARDCIRVSDLNEAEKLLTRYSRQNWQDYRSACGLAFIRMERGEYRDAGDFFRDALNQSASPVQKTYIYLLISRIYELLEKRDKSLEALKEALRIEPYCLEARFEEAIRHFQMGRQTEGLNRLAKLLQLSYEFYVPALISPELSEFRPLIVPELDKLGAEVLKEAREAAKEADAGVAALTRFLGAGEAGVAEILAMQERLHGLLAKPEIFLLCREALHSAKRITADCGVIERERRNDVVKAVGNLRVRAGTLVQGGGVAVRMGLRVRPILERLKGIEEDLRRREPLARCVERCGQLSGELDEAEEIARRWEERAELLHACGTFLKDLSFVLFITVVTGLVLFPGVLYCLDALNAGSALSSAELWPVQKSVLIVGAVLAVVVALGHAVIGRPKTDGGVKSK